MSEVPPESAAAIEQRTIAEVPASERHGRVRNLFTIWFGSNVMLLTIVTGALATTAYGLPLGWSALAVVIGNLFGGVFMALHSAQGPRLGVPQMIQSRGQFGAYGALVVVVVVIIMYLGFVASNSVLGGQSLNNLIPSLSVNLGIIIISVVSLAVCIYGHDMSAFPSLTTVNPVVTVLMLAERAAADRRAQRLHVAAPHATLRLVISPNSDPGAPR